MGKTRARKANFHPFESISENSPYIRLTCSMINSKAWQELNTYEQVLYLHLKLEYNGKSGKDKNIKFPYKDGLKLMSKRVFTRSIDKLIEVGLIDLIVHRPYSTECNIYGLSDRWHKYGTPDFVEKIRPKRKCHK